MRPYGNQSYLKKKVSSESQKNSKKICKPYTKLILQIFDSINTSLIILIFTLFFLSLDSQRKWSKTYKTLSETKVMSNNLIDYISKTEEFYIGELESRNTYKSTKPKDLIYLDKIAEKKESFFMKNSRIFIKGFRDSKFLRGY